MQYLLFQLRSISANHWPLLAILVIVFSTSTSLECQAQKYANHWYFGDYFGLDFTNGAAVFDPANPNWAEEGVISMSDEDGNFLFYSDGYSIFNAQFQVMPNGGLLNSNGSVSERIAIQHPDPDSSHLYYLFGQGNLGVGPIFKSQFMYSVVDMNKLGGLGDVVLRDSVIFDAAFPARVTEMVTAVKHANGHDVWVMAQVTTFDGTADTLFRFLLTSIGLTGPTKTPVNVDLALGINQTKFSPDGRYYTTGASGGSALFPFDNSTGTLSNHFLVYGAGGNNSGREFSCDGSKFYVGFGEFLYQYDVSIPDSAIIQNSEVLLDSGLLFPEKYLQLGPDQRIYGINLVNGTIEVINQPNLPGTACDFQDSLFDISSWNFATLSLPKFEPTCLCVPQILAVKRCFSDTTMLELTPQNNIDSVLWDFGDPMSTSNSDTGFTTTHIYSTPDFFTAQAIYHKSGLVDTATYTFEILSAPQLNLGSDTSLCPGDSLVLDAAFSSTVSYLWNDSSSDSTFVVYPIDTVWVTLSNACGVASDTLVVDTLPVLFLDLGPDTTICPGDSFVLQAYHPTASYTWQDGSTNSSFLVTAQGLYAVTITNGCFTETDSIQIDSLPVPWVDLGPDTVLCEGDTIDVLTNTALVNYLWQDSSTNQQLQAFQVGQYWLNVSNVCGSFTDTLNIDSLIPALVHLPGDSILCAGDTVMLDATVALGSYLWQDNSTASTFSATQTGTYWAEATNACGISSDTVFLDFLAVPQPNFGPDTILCVGDTLILDANTYLSSYFWQDASTDSILTVTQAGLYSATVTNQCFNGTDSIQVDYIDVPSFDLGADTFLCEGLGKGLSASGDLATFLWHTGSTDSNIIVQQGGLKWATASNICGSFSDSIFLTDILFPLVQLPGDTALCENDSTVLNATFSGAWYLWQNQNTDSVQLVQDSGVYWVEVQNQCGTSTDTIQVGLDDSLIFDLGPDTVLCMNDTLSLSTYLSVTYPHFWQDSSSLNEFLVLVNGNYWVFVENACGQASDTVVVAFANIPEIDLGNDSLLCNGDSVLLDASFPFADYSWNTSESSAQIVAKTENTYRVTVTNLCGTAEDSIFVDFEDFLTLSLGPDRIGCVGLDETLTATTNHPATILWNTGAPTASITVSESGSFWAEATNVCGSVFDTVEVAYLNFPSVSLPADLTLCPGDSAWIVGQSSNDNLLWSTGSTDTAIWVSAGGQYTLSASNFCGSATDTMNIIIQSALQVDLGADKQVCPGKEVVLKPYPANLTYSWQDGSTGRSLAVFEAGAYWVEGMNEFGCIGSDTINITQCPGVWVPSAFTPDGDRLNDEFLVQGENLQEFHLFVFNRWGQLIFETKNPTHGWNGNFEGVLAPQGVYSWKLSFINADRQEEIRAGKVTLIR